MYLLIIFVCWSRRHKHLNENKNKKNGDTVLLNEDYAPKVNPSLIHNGTCINTTL